MKRNLIYFFIFLTIVLMIVVCYKNNQNNDYEKNNILNQKNEFIINKIQYYSTVNAVSNTTNYQNPEWR